MHQSGRLLARYSALIAHVIRWLLHQTQLIPTFIAPNQTGYPGLIWFLPDQSTPERERALVNVPATPAARARLAPATWCPTPPQVAAFEVGPGLPRQKGRTIWPSCCHNGRGSHHLHGCEWTPSAQARCGATGLQDARGEGTLTDV
jgi:hypothetical protein